MSQIMKRKLAIEILKEIRKDCEGDVMKTGAIDRALFDMRQSYKLEIKSRRHNKKPRCGKSTAGLAK